MSVLISGMEASTRCYGCKFELYGQYCLLLGKYTNNTRAIGRLDDCPVVGLPEKHGRLIDADEINFSMTNSTDQDIAEEAINETPTVIEAEGE